MMHKCDTDDKENTKARFSEPPAQRGESPGWSWFCKYKGEGG